MSEIVSIHPYFLVHEGKMNASLALLPRLAEKTALEPGCLCYDFTIRRNLIHCRNSYFGAQGLLDHMKNVADLVEKLLTLCDLARLEVHGSAAELQKLKEPLAELSPKYFEYVTGVTKDEQ